MKKRNRSCCEQDVIFDVNYFLQDIYLAKLKPNGNELRILFDNGQQFSISVKEIN